MNTILSLNNYLNNPLIGQRISVSRIDTNNLPFPNLYSSLDQLSSKLDKAISTISILKNMAVLLGGTGSMSNGTIPNWYGITLGILMIDCRWGRMISVGSDLMTSLKNYEFYQAAWHGCRFAVLIHPTSLELQVALTAIQIISELKMVYKSLRNDRYIEAIASFSLAGLRSYQICLQMNPLTPEKNQIEGFKNFLPNEAEIAYYNLINDKEEGEFFGKDLLNNQEEIAKYYSNCKVSMNSFFQNEKIKSLTNVIIPENLVEPIVTCKLIWQMLTRVIPSFFISTSSS